MRPHPVLRSSIVFGQQPVCPDATTEKVTIQNLLAEVRQLRLSVERSASLMPRMQLTLTRFQMQQERVDRIAAELKEFRSMMKQAVFNKERAAAQIKELESQTGQLDPQQRSQIEMTKKELASQLEAWGQSEQQERVQELELSTHLQAEQAKLDDLADQLNALDKRLQQVQ
jgi:septal ring factor EnvC (AmiA/AmiB activator)